MIIAYQFLWVYSFPFSYLETHKYWGKFHSAFKCIQLSLEKKIVALNILLGTRGLFSKFLQENICFFMQSVHYFSTGICRQFFNINIMEFCEINPSALKLLHVDTQIR